MSRAYKRSPEVRAKMSAARKKAWADPEVRAKMSAASKKALADPEVRAKMSAASKKAWADRRNIAIPEEFKQYYNKLARILGVKEARREIERQMKTAVE